MAFTHVQTRPRALVPGAPTPNSGRLTAGYRTSGLVCRALLSPRDEAAATRRSMLFASGLLVAFTKAAPSAAVDFAEAQAEREARKQAMLEAARAKATGQPLPEGMPEGLGTYEGPSASVLDTSKLSYPSSDAPKAEKKSTAAKKAPKKAPAKKAKAAAKKSDEGGGVLSLDKSQLGKERAARRAELLQKAREKALQEAQN